MSGTVDASYAGVQGHLDRLIAGVRAELASETAQLGRLDRPDEHGVLPRLLLLDLLLANVLLWLVLPEYALYWITASFFLYVIYPFLLLVPSAESGEDEPGPGRGGPITDRLGRLGLAEHRWLIARIFWNSFFINSQPLVPAFLGVYGLNLVFALFGNYGLLGWLIGFQSAAIMLFYLAIAVFRPYTGGFLESLIDIQNNVSGKIHRRVAPLWRVVLPIGIAAGLVGLLLIAAMLLPGFTLGVIWKSNATVTGLGFVPVLFLLVCQVVLVRYTQGASSRRLVRQLLERKVAILNRHVLAPLDEYRREADRASPGVLDRFATDFSGIRATFLSSKVYRMQRQDLGGLFPVWVVVPDLELLLNSETIRILDEQPDSRQIL